MGEPRPHLTNDKLAELKAEAQKAIDIADDERVEFRFVQWSPVLILQLIEEIEEHRENRWKMDAGSSPWWPTSRA